ncbi:MAG: DMT family transporter [Methanomassiliicoccales archaeon]
MSAERRKAFLVLLLAVFCFSFSSIFIRMSEAPAPAIAAYRMVLATLLIAPFALLRLRSKPLTLGRNDAWFLLATGLVLALHFLFFVSAVQNTTVASATVLINSHPIFVVFLAFLLLHEGNRFTTMGALVGVAGIIVISLGDLGSGNIAGDMLAVLGAAMEALYIIMTRFMRRKVDIMTFVLLVNGACAAFLVLICVATGVPLWPYSERELLLFLGMAIIPATLGYTLYNWSLKYLLAPQVSVTQLGEALFASAMAVVLFSEFPSASLLLGALLIVTGIYLAVSRRKRESLENI